MKNSNDQQKKIFILIAVFGHCLKLIASILIDLKLDLDFIKNIFETSKIQLAFELFVFSAL